MFTSCVSKCQPFGKSGRIGRSIMRAVSVPFSPARPSRLKNEPGILPAAYMRSSTSTVSGRKSTSRSEPTVAVLRTMVSPWRTTTAPPACLATRPVSKLISVPAMSTATVVTESLLIVSWTFFLGPPVGRQARFSYVSYSEPSHRSGRNGVPDVCGGRRGGPAAQGVAHVAGDALRDGVRAPVGVEALDVEPERRAALPQVRVVDAARVVVEGVVHRPEGAVERRGLGGVCERDGPRVARA